MKPFTTWRGQGVHTAFAAAGVQLLRPPELPVVPPLHDGAGMVLSDAALTELMRLHFERYPDPHVWLLHAHRHDTATTTLGKHLFDAPSRAAAVVFYDPMYGNVPRQLFTCVHEVGHCLGLSHPFERPGWTLETALPETISWMDYPDRFAGCDPTLWHRFPFAFDEADKAELRRAVERFQLGPRSA